MATTVLITGGNSGFGLLITKTLSVNGINVYAGYRNQARANELFALQEQGLPVQPVQLDVTNADEVQKAVDLVEKNGGADILINCAGYGVKGPVDQLTEQELSKQFDTNVIGVQRMIRAVVPAMRTRKSGTIINISSVAGTVGVPYEGAYCASKHALEALSESLWYELRPFGINVVIVSPGAYRTNFSENLISSKFYSEDSPHWEYGQEFQAAANFFVDNIGVQDSQDVADLILSLSQSKNPKLRYRIGADAEMLIPLHRSVEFEVFAEKVYEMLGLAQPGSVVSS